jgi:hypothetical protein
MDINDRLTNETYLLYCAQNYDNINCHTTEEFYEDLKRIKYVKKLLTRYVSTGELKERLILNHIIILNNVFGPYVTSKLLWFKVDKHIKYLKPFLIYLNILPDRLYNIGNENVIWTDDYPLDDHIINSLRKL